MAGDVKGGNQIEVFQDLNIRVPRALREVARAALIDAAKTPWMHAGEKEALVGMRSIDDEDIIAFERTAGEDIDAVGLVLWSRDDGYEVLNIVPLEDHELSRIRYNRALQDFLAKVAAPAAAAAGFAVDLGASTQGLDDWLSADAAAALRRFSVTANRSTGSSHPMDQRRWFSFLIAVHSNRTDFTAERLIRWLCEVEGWSMEKARDLAIEYEYGLALLDEYDRLGRAP